MRTITSHFRKIGVVNLEDQTATIDVGGQKFQMSGLRSSANLDYDYPYYKEGLAEIKSSKIQRIIKFFCRICRTILSFMWRMVLI